MSQRRRFRRQTPSSGKPSDAIFTNLGNYMDTLERQGYRFEGAPPGEEPPVIRFTPEQDEAIEAVMARDRAYFAAHPGVTEFVRPACLADFPEDAQSEFLAQGLDPTVTHQVTVTLLGPGARARRIEPVSRW